MAGVTAKDDSELARSNHGRVPIPDPTVLTTAALQREITAAREVVEQNMASMKELFDARLDSIQMQFSERDKRFELRALDEKVAVAAALMAQKEATAKSEMAITKQIDQMHMLVNTITGANAEKIADLKSRIDMGEGKGKGAGEIWGHLIAIAAIVVSIGTFLVLMLANHK